MGKQTTNEAANLARRRGDWQALRSALGDREARPDDLGIRWDEEALEPVETGPDPGLVGAMEALAIACEPSSLVGVELHVHVQDGEIVLTGWRGGQDRPARAFRMRLTDDEPTEAVA